MKNLIVSAYKIYLKTAGKLIREDFTRIYDFFTPILSKPCLTILKIIGSLFIFAQIVLLIIFVLFVVRYIIGKMGYPVRRTMHQIYTFLLAVSVIQIFICQYIIIIPLQFVVLMVFVAAVGMFILDPE
ncbi:Protein CBG27777 [Caenorhabditis briggsae]|uniref:Uncharacterized protein n=2 Tax=Caenorhabditis briggsae TaxID=6238 RepID=A0AAE9CV76_CAEBR|nr:Protein CBG27777 [Caenorhabditis briggsae]ULT82987.1 hypothetical protein L3Y34_012310 [Caenorhabditis briggsae]CAR99544.1 Protein CBG27777 [Caenorhabditis briggsae]